MSESEEAGLKRRREYIMGGKMLIEDDLYRAYVPPELNVLICHT